jgi:hypothetical protein
MTLLEYDRPPGVVFETQDDLHRFWVERIDKAWAKVKIGVRQTVEGVIETGRELQAAKDNLPRGLWMAMFDAGKLPFGLDKAECFMKIARNDILANSEHIRILPASWATLRELDKLDDAVLEAAIKDGAIHPLMQRKEAVALRPQKPRGPRTPIDKPATPHDDLAGELQDTQENNERLEQTNQQLLEQWRDIDSLIARLAQLSSRLTADNKVKIAGDVLAALRVSAEDLNGRKDRSMTCAARNKTIGENLAIKCIKINI